MSSTTPQPCSAILALLVGFSFLLSPCVVARDDTFANWRTQHGLPSNKITSLLQTRDGYMWIGRSSGALEQVEWRMRPNGWLDCTYTYRPEAEGSLQGVAFDFPADKVRAKRWIGHCPPAWRFWMLSPHGQQVHPRCNEGPAGAKTGAPACLPPHPELFIRAVNREM